MGFQRASLGGLGEGSQFSRSTHQGAQTVCRKTRNHTPDHSNPPPNLNVRKLSICPIQAILLQLLTKLASGDSNMQTRNKNLLTARSRTHNPESLPNWETIQHSMEGWCAWPVGLDYTAVLLGGTPTLG